MAEITAQLVKDLRESTGAGMMDSKKALIETGGEQLKKKTWKTLTKVGGICATVAGGAVYIINWLLKP